MQRLEFTLDGASHSLSFAITQPAEWLILRFHWESQNTWGELRLTDPLGRLRFNYMDVHGVRAAVIHREPEFNSYSSVPGGIEEGRWTLQFIRFVPQSLWIEWESGHGELPDGWNNGYAERNLWNSGYSPNQQQLMLNAYDWEQCLEKQARWYKGDCHGHTLVSDGKMTPDQTMEQAKRMALDFFFVTEHNILPSSWPKGQILVIPGMEFTSFGRGDWNALGLRAWIDTKENLTDTDQLRLLHEAHAQGAVRVINHPMCGRVAWRYPDTPVSCMDAIEIWNSPAAMNKALSNDRSLKVWTALWNEGYRIPGIGGSDTHGFPDETVKWGDKPQTLGDPATYVYASELSPLAILNAIRAGHAYVSRGPQMQVQYLVEEISDRFTFGDDLTEAINKSIGGTVYCSLTITSAQGYILRCVHNGAETTADRIEEENQTFQFQFRWKSGGFSWSRFEIRNEFEQLMAVSNPVSYGSKNPSKNTWGEILASAGLTLPPAKPSV